MRRRHAPRLCGDCGRPMAGQEDACWSCGTLCPVEDRPQPRLTALEGGGGTAIPIEIDGVGHEIAVAVALPEPVR
jgi:hypothetical protein